VPVAAAQVSDTDLQIAARAFGFLQEPIRGTAEVDIIYDPANSASQEEAEALRDRLAGGYSAGMVSLTPDLVAVGDVSTALDAPIAFVTQGVADRYPAVREAVAASGTLSFSTDLGCVEAGACVMAVSSTPRVRIVVNNATAASADIEFQEAFRMMVEEI
jgi:hypothetical protein